MNDFIHELRHDHRVIQQAVAGDFHLYAETGAPYSAAKEGFVLAFL